MVKKKWLKKTKNGKVITTTPPPPTEKAQKREFHIKSHAPLSVVSYHFLSVSVSSSTVFVIFVGCTLIHHTTQSRMLIPPSLSPSHHFVWFVGLSGCRVLFALCLFSCYHTHTSAVLMFWVVVLFVLSLWCLPFFLILPRSFLCCEFIIPD